MSQSDRTPEHAAQPGADHGSERPARGFRMPDTLALMFFLMIAALVLTWILPAGSYEQVTNEAGREVVVPGTYEVIEDAETLKPWALFTSVPKAMEGAADIIVFILIIGGAMSVIRSTGAIEAFLAKFITRFDHRPALLIGAGMLVFGIASATLGMAEEYIPLVAILIALCRAMKMDVVAAIGIMVCGYCIGYGATWVNPFTLFIAQGIAELQPGSGFWFRFFIFWPFLAIGVHHVWRYATKVQADPSASLVADVPGAQPPKITEQPPLDGTRKAVIALTVGAIGLMIWGITQQGWYLNELGAMFIALAIVVGLAARMSIDDVAIGFTKGAAELAGTAILIGFARAIAVLLEDGQVLHTIVHGLAEPLVGLPAELSAVGMLAIQALINLFVSSGSGQAFLTMPLMAPIGDLVGIERQVSVLAYHFGDGFVNMVAPTNPVLMGILGLAGIPYLRWLKFVVPLLLKLLALAAVFMVVAVQIGYR
ncbi:AbgT family transporter [Halomonas denitrificans]|nr:AbgT family transporter [Halomonas denitrificans]